MVIGINRTVQKMSPTEYRPTDIATVKSLGDGLHTAAVVHNFTSASRSHMQKGNTKIKPHIYVCLTLLANFANIKLMLIAVMLILILVLKDSLRTKFKSLSLSLQV